MNGERRETKLIKTIQTVMKRYERYTRYLNYPGEWGERAFRGWLVFDLFHVYLRWPINNIVFGETYDVLFVDDDVKPMIYLETKKPGRGLADFDEFKQRIPGYQTLHYAVLANGYDWLMEDILNNTRQVIKLEAPHKKWEEFIRPLEAKNYLYGIWK